MRAAAQLAANRAQRGDEAARLHHRILALSLISILPQLIVFFCAQDQFVEGISAGAVKG